MKRASERQITKDDPSSDGEGEPEPLRDGFEKAPPEVMAKRKILKARRSIRSDEVNAPKLNPFAGVLGKPANGLASPPSGSAGAAAATAAAPVSSSPAAGPGDAPTTAGVTATAEKATQPAAESGLPKPAPEALSAVVEVPASEKADDNKSTEGGEVANAQETDSTARKDEPDIPATGKAADSSATGATSETKANPTQDTPAVSGKPLASGSEDAGSAEVRERLETGHSANAEQAKEGMPLKSPATSAKEPAAPGASDANDHPAKEGSSGTDASTPTKQTAAAASSKPAFSFGGIAASGARTGTTFVDAAAAATGFSFVAAAATNPEVPERQKETAFVQTEVVTGEEDEVEKFKSRCKLFVLESSKWVERGVGNLKLNTHSATKRSRLVMRTDATLRVVLNTPVTSHFNVDPASERSVRFQGLSVDDVKKHATYLARFSSKTELDRFTSALKSVGCEVPSE